MYNAECAEEAAYQDRLLADREASEKRWMIGALAVMLLIILGSAVGAGVLASAYGTLATILAAMLGAIVAIAAIVLFAWMVAY